MRVFCASAVCVIRVAASHCFNVMMKTRLPRTSTHVKHARRAVATDGTSTRLENYPPSSTFVLMAPRLDDKEMIIVENIKTFREEAGYTQQHLAELADVSVDGVRKWEGKRGAPDRDSLEKLAAAFGRTMDDFFLKDPPPPHLPPMIRPFILKVLDDAPLDLARIARAQIDQLNHQAIERRSRVTLPADASKMTSGRKEHRGSEGSSRLRPSAKKPSRP